MPVDQARSGPAGRTPDENGHIDRDGRTGRNGFVASDGRRSFGVVGTSVFDVARRSAIVRDAREDELATVMNVLDGAALEIDASAVRERMPGCVLVAVADGRVVGAYVVEPPGRERRTGDVNPRAGAHVDAIAVRPGRRGQGVGASMVESGAARWGTLTAEFDERVRPFYESLGFDVEPLGEGRFRGVRPADGDGGTRSSGDRR